MLCSKVGKIVGVDDAMFDGSEEILTGESCKLIDGDSVRTVGMLVGGIDGEADGTAGTKIGPNSSSS